MNQFHSRNNLFALVILSLVASVLSNCAHDDMVCWSRLARQYTNDVRRRHGTQKDLRDGLERQLSNAIEYAGQLASIGELRHQPLAEITELVGCGRWIGGENVAYNSEGSGDFAKACVDQWENSAGHLENIMRETFDEVVVGFYLSPDGTVYCVQTFSSVSHEDVVNFANHDNCASMDAGAGSDMGHDENFGGGIGGSEGNDSDGNEDPNENQFSVYSDDGEEDDDEDGGPGNSIEKEQNRSCRCMELGERCWKSLEAKSGGRCNAFTSAFHQPPECHNHCCEYCKTHPTSQVCLNDEIGYICNVFYSGQ